MIENQGWVSYFTTGPNREPVYPLLIALSMVFEHMTGFAYVKIMAIFGVIIMFLTQILAYKILRLLNIRHAVCALVLAYLALVGTLIFIYILFFSFVWILTRYALPIAPLYLIAIGVWIDQNLCPKKII